MEPPRTVTSTIAFSNASRVRIARGRRSSSSSRRSAAPTLRHSSRFRALAAGVELLYGSVIPSASAAAAIVFAVYIPPHAPAPGQAWATTASCRASSISPAMSAPYDSNAETMSSRSPSSMPGAIVPPYTITPGRSSRAIAISEPGMFLSQPGTVTTPSYHCADTTVSMESAMRSRDGSE